MEHSDVILLERWARERDAEAFNEIVTRYSGLVYATCRRVLGDRTQAEDVSQECFVRLAGKTPSIRSSLGAWLHRVATNESLNLIKAQSRRREREQRYAEGAAATAEPDFDDIQDLVDEAIEGLPEKLRSVVVAHFLERKTHEAIAEEAGVTRQAVSYRVQKGVELVRDALRKRGVSMTVAGLSALLAANMAESAPLALTAALGKVAVAGTGAAKAAGAAAAGHTAKGVVGALVLKKLAVGLVLAAVLALGVLALGVWSMGAKDTESAGPDGMLPALASEDIDKAPSSEEGEDAGESLAVEPEEDVVEVPAAAGDGQDEQEEDGVGAVETDAGSGSVVGRVYDAESGESLEGVRVRVYLNDGEPDIEESGTSVPSDASGQYRITGLPDGRYTVVPDGPLYAMKQATFLSDGSSSRKQAGAEGYPPQDWRKVARTLSLRRGVRSQTIDVALDKTATCIRISGIVLSADGEPVSTALVGLMTEEILTSRSVRSNSDGTFEVILDTAARTLYAAARTDDMESPLAGPMSLEEYGLDGLELRLTLPRTGTIAGTVVDRFDRPVADVSVYLVRGKLSDVLGFQGVDKTTSSEDGAFSIGALSAGTYGIVPSHQNTPWLPHERAVSRTVDLAEGQALRGLRVPFSQADGLVISGRVVDSAGKPIGKAVVDWTARGKRAKAYCDDDGAFVLAGLEEGDYLLTANKFGYTNGRLENVPAGSEGVEIVLQGMGAVEGRVVRADTGAPVGDFQASHSAASDTSTRFRPTMLSNARRFTDPEGRFRLEEVAAGDIVIAAKADGLAPSFQVVFVEEGETSGGIELRLAPGVHVEGEVVTAAGEAVSGAAIYMGPLPPNGMGERALVARSDAGGHFVIEGLSPDILQLSARHPDYGAARARVAPTVRLVFSDSGAIRGTVMVNGEPLPDLRVMAVSGSNPGGVQQGKTGMDGSYAITQLVPGDWSVMLDQRSGWTGMRQAVVEAGQATQVDFDLRAGTAVLEGRVTIGGEAPERASVGVVIGDEAARSTLVGSSGAYRLDKIPGGSVLLHASGLVNGQMLAESVELEVVEGTTTQYDIDIALPGGQGCVAGHVFVPEGTPARHVMLGVREGHLDLPAMTGMDTIREGLGQCGPSILKAQCSEDGTFNLRGLEPGDYTVSALAMGHAEDGQSDPERAVLVSVPITIRDDAPVPVEFDLRQE